MTDNFRVDQPTKGLPVGGESLDRAAIRTAGWRLFHEHIPLPAAVLRSSALAQNSRWMRQFLAGFNASIAPHGKTTMSPQLFDLQEQDGCWGITLATCYQVQVARRHGCNRILLANEVVGRADIDYLVSEMAADPGFDFYCYVDSIESVDRLAEGVRRRDLRRPLKVLIEMGFVGGRCGTRSVPKAVEVAERVRTAGAGLALAGIAGFEGLYQSRWNEDRVQLVEAFLKLIVDAAIEIDRLGLFDDNETILSAGGSAYYDLVLERFSAVKLMRPVRVVTRSGCYLTQDSGMYHRLQGELRQRSGRATQIEPQPDDALEVWTYVLSRPEPELAILSAGRRDFGTDAGNPLPLKWTRPAEPAKRLSGCEVVGVSDQHAHMRIPADHALQVGDMVGLGVSHPCTTFDKWKLIYLVDDDYRIIDAIQTFF
jgi:D-serine dehydratase